MVRYGVLLALIAVTYSYAGEDPTAPLGWVSPAKPELQKPSYPVPTLQSIVCAEGRSCYAIIEQRVVAQGGCGEWVSCGNDPSRSGETHPGR